MKKILITGANSYIGTSFERYLKENFSNGYQVDTIDLRNKSWREKDFLGFDCVVHVAGLVHQKETKENALLYYQINRDLTFEVAQKAKSSNVPQFIFLSTMAIYGRETGVTTSKTIPKPKTNYGKSKLQAEEKLKILACSDFKICILRLPMVYGEGCKGNYQTLVKIVDKFPVFPRIKNKKSLVRIDNLVDYIKTCIDQEFSGVFVPQNKNYTSTMELVKEIAEKKNKKIYFSFLCGVVVVCLRPFVKKLKKAFGSSIYKETKDSECKKQV